MVKIGGLLLGLLLSIVVARLIGAEGIGIINLSNRIVNISLLFGLFGIQNIIVRSVASSKKKQNYNSISNLIHTSVINNGTLTILISILLISLSGAISNSFFNEPNLKIPLQIALSVMTFQVISRIYSSGLVGLNKIWQSNLVDQALSIFVTLVLLSLLLALNIEITVILVAIIYATSRLFVTLSIFLYWENIFPYKAKKIQKSIQLFKSSFPLFVASISTTIINNIDLIVLGILSTSKEVGIYSVAAQIAMIPRTILLVVNSALSPKISGLFGTEQIEALESLIQRTIRILVILSIGVLMVFLLGGKFILSLWGNSFTDAYYVLVILGFGQAYNLATGPTGVTLVMCELDQIFRNNQMIMMTFSIISSIVFTYFWGIVGIALAQALTIILNNSIQIVIIKFKLGSLNFFYAKYVIKKLLRKIKKKVKI